MNEIWYLTYPVICIFGYIATNSICGALLFSALAFIVDLLHTIHEKNPFDRVLWHKGYRISHGGRHFSRSEITFTKHAQIDSLRDAVFDVVYGLGRQSEHSLKPSIRFSNFVSWNTIAWAFEPFHFSEISFWDIDPEVLRCYDLMKLPCDELVLPQHLHSIEIDGAIPYIHNINLMCSGFVKLVHSPSYPCEAPGQLDITVDPKLLHLYLSDPAWSTLKTVDPDGNVRPATFNRYHIASGK